MGLVSWVRPRTRLGNWSTRGRRDQLMRDQSGECTGVGWVAHTIGDAGVGSVGSVWLVGWLAERGDRPMDSSLGPKGLANQLTT
jgi:hypothetical protein